MGGELGRSTDTYIVRANLTAKDRVVLDHLDELDDMDVYSRYEETGALFDERFRECRWSSNPSRSSSSEFLALT